MNHAVNNDKAKGTHRLIVSESPMTERNLGREQGSSSVSSSSDSEAEQEKCTNSIHQVLNRCLTKLTNNQMIFQLIF